MNGYGSYEFEDKGIQVPKDETDLSLILKKRMQGIENELLEFNSLIGDFLYAVDSEMENFTVNMGKLQKNLNKVHMMKVGEDDHTGQAA